MSRCIPFNLCIKCFIFADEVRYWSICCCCSPLPAIIQNRPNPFHATHAPDPCFQHELSWNSGLLNAQIFHSGCIVVPMNKFLRWERHVFERPTLNRSLRFLKGCHAQRTKGEVWKMQVVANLAESYYKHTKISSNLSFTLNKYLLLVFLHFNRKHYYLFKSIYNYTKYYSVTFYVTKKMKNSLKSIFT